MEKAPEQVMAKIYASALAIMILLLVGAGIASFLETEFRGFDVSAILVRFYLLIIPGTLFAFTIAMFVRRVMNLAVAGMILSLLWLVFKWLG